jgi:hypothetical protein
MGQQRTIKTTLGELVTAVTEEVTALMGDSPRGYVVVSYVLADLLSRYRIREPKNPRRAMFKNN